MRRDLLSISSGGVYSGENDRWDQNTRSLSSGPCRSRILVMATSHERMTTLDDGSYHWLPQDDIVATRLTFAVTHKGEIFGVPTTNKTITFEAMEFFKVIDGLITESWGSWPIHDIIQKLQNCPNLSNGTTFRGAYPKRWNFRCHVSATALYFSTSSSVVGLTRFTESCQVRN
jgi:hypothetical protein